jgi:hypothetical protein
MSTEQSALDGDWRPSIGENRFEVDVNTRQDKTVVNRLS